MGKNVNMFPGTVGTSKGANPLAKEAKGVGERGRKRLFVAEERIFGVLEAAKKGYWRGVVLWANEKNVDARDENGVTLLMVAMAQERLSTAERLVRMGADVHAVDNEGRGIEWYEENGKGLFPVVPLKGDGSLKTDKSEKRDGPSFEGILGC